MTASTSSRPGTTTDRLPPGNAAAEATFHTISSASQVILFTQEEVLAWAQARLQAPQDRRARYRRGWPPGPPRSFAFAHPRVPTAGSRLPFAVNPYPIRPAPVAATVRPMVPFAERGTAMTVKEGLHLLVDSLDDIDAREALEYFRWLGQESEPLTEEETARARAGEAQIVAGDHISLPCGWAAASGLSDQVRIAALG